MERFDVFGEILPELKIKFFLTAFLGRAGRRVTVRRGIAKNRGAKLFIDEDAGFVLWNA